MQELLQKIASLKAEIDTCGALDNALIKNLDEWYTVELTYTSNALEGNTLTRQETALVIEKDFSIEGKKLSELLETKNHAEAVGFIREFSRNKKDHKVTLLWILELHSHILQKIDDTNAGRLRTVPVRVAGSTSVFPNPAKVPELMNEFINWLSSAVSAPTNAVEAHYNLVSIHPFIDGNGRVARLLMNTLLMQDGFPPLIIPKETRRAYVVSLEKGQTTGVNDDYYRFMYERLIASMEEYLKMSKIE
ncbi:MAG: hypothetical protein A3C08_02870 [Candidatus Taylorbacteria bacterium RIFCSPHIGHO2_02_FULL_47_18]|uniref:Fido domain-containing protein n=1 Tax=Candidatus Taylorbacteria bacterium RIFCSPLOWO2_01_FULL_48_100 TaxID=1802322 RepID=A0A1G2NCI3_9BACT|nr:MAG: hypothetical protein A2670_01130 [Candidatus Taylorbacteria bacterium RIFCSPHIGHO2_01_FULL_48_38]OHA27640.1 MAG: hypothetical protein A3C08_02870 [Candidatus Taylorbacteria bacterium RIFCSPHIGHO2_02_FULL_47_18]OHA33804.1 MAG: hypothetical protein A2938_01570 [Candidatus Taylorbacteria bacterium RIFCSPLOWO2_01_FULL_48_100]OHA40486.1 MAG: hypothetical protein A3J31_02890 [Candidatus Taylorbacteria bacterium RIFCSPLOWO2_02_FULL_48_16]OHA45645.1 MAG: hypothetical protein A3H13_00765 [Candid